MPEQRSFTDKISQAITVTTGAAGSSNVNGAILDMSGWEGVLIVVQMEAIVATAVTSIKAQQGDDSGLSDAQDLAGTGQTIADSDDEKTFVFDLYRPTDRYIRLVALRATANATLTATYHQYGARKEPATHEATVIVVEQHSSAAEGAP